MALRITVQMDVQEGKSAELERRIGAIRQQAMATNPGCEMWDLFRSKVEPNSYALIERWTSEADLDVHKASQAMEDWPAIEELLARPEEAYRAKE